MTVRVKILALSVVLLLLFGGVLMVSIAMQRRTSHQVAAIIEFHLPLAAAIADLDVATDAYELIVQRLLLLPDIAPAAVIVIVMGKSEPIRIFELLGPAGSLESGILELRDLYVQGLEAYRQLDWDTAEKRLQQRLRLHLDDGPSRVLLERIAAYREVAPAPGWNGVWRLGEK